MTPVEFAARPQKGKPRNQFGAEPPEEWRGGGVRCAEPAVPGDAISLTSPLEFVSLCSVRSPPPPPQFTSPAGDADPTPKTHGSRGKGGWEADQTRPFTKPKLSGRAQKMLRPCDHVREMFGRWRDPGTCSEAGRHKAQSLGRRV